MIHLQALMQAIEHEIEVTVRVHEVRSEYERQMEEYVIDYCLFYIFFRNIEVPIKNSYITPVYKFRRARMAKEVARLREENELLKNAKIRWVVILHKPVPVLY